MANLPDFRRFEKPPTSYRAGRYGFDLTSAEILADLGYIVDSSVLPLHDYRRKKGPDFMMAEAFVITSFPILRVASSSKFL